MKILGVANTYQVQRNVNFGQGQNYYEKQIEKWGKEKEKAESDWQNKIDELDKFMKTYDANDKAQYHHYHALHWEVEKAHDRYKDASKLEQSYKNDYDAAKGY